MTFLDRFTAFATYLLHNPEFTWTISTDKLRVEALGTIFDNVTLKKDITLAAFNGLPGVTISNFVLPSDDPAGGIHIETDALIPSPSRKLILLQYIHLTNPPHQNWELTWALSDFWLTMKILK